MDIAQLRLFCLLAEELHFGKVSRRAHIAQSAVTAHIRQLEELLGARLFERGRRSPVRMTPAGSLLLPEARKAVDQFDAAVAIGRRAARGEIGRLRIGFVTSAVFSGLLGRLVHAFRLANPQIGIEMEEMESPRQIMAIQAGSLDLGFVRPGAFAEGLIATEIMSERLVIAVRDDDPLPAIRNRVPPAALAGRPFVVTLDKEEFGLHEAVQAVARVGGFKADVAYRVRNLISLLGLVDAGLALAVVPESLRTVGLKHVAFRELDMPPLRETLCLVSAGGHHAGVIERFRDHCVSAGAEVRP